MQKSQNSNMSNAADLQQGPREIGLDSILSVPHTQLHKVIQGKCTFKLGRAIAAISVHGFNGQALCTGSSTCELPKGVTFGVLINGFIDFKLNDVLHSVNATNEPKLFCYNLKQPTQFKRLLSPNVLVYKIIVTVPPELILQAIENTPAINQEFLQSHATLFQWPANSELINTAMELELLTNNKTTTKPNPQAYLLRDAKALELTAIALNHFTPANSLQGSQYSHQYNYQKTTRQYSNCSIQHTSPERIRDQVDKLLVPPGSSVSVQSFAQQLNMSLSKLQRIFKKNFGQTVYDYTRDQRLKNAYAALKSNKISIGEAAYLAGYKHVSNFALAYKNQFGETPGSTAIKTSENEKLTTPLRQEPTPTSILPANERSKITVVKHPV